MRGSKRGIRDGIVLFGKSHNKNEESSKNTNNIKVDYEIDLSNEDLQLKNHIIPEVLFFIYFNKENAKYFIRINKSKLSNSNNYSDSPNNVLVQIVQPYVRLNFIF